MTTIATTRSEFKANLIAKYVGKTLKTALCELPAAVLDLAAINRGCDRMNDAVPVLGEVRLRIGRDSHRMIEVIKLQLGDPSPDLVVRLQVENITDAEVILPLCVEYQEGGASVNVLYATIPTANTLLRLAAFSTTLAAAGGTLSVLIDDRSQFALLQRLCATSRHPMYVYMLLDSGQRISGLDPTSNEYKFIFKGLEQIATREGPPTLVFVGFYTTLPYTPSQFMASEALDVLTRQLATVTKTCQLKHLNLCIGPSPILPILGTFLQDTHDPNNVNLQTALRKHIVLMAKIRTDDHTVEVVTDLGFGTDVKTLWQHCISEPIPGMGDILQWADVPLTVLTTIPAIYAEREDRKRPEFLIAAGKRVLGGHSGKVDTTEGGMYGCLAQWNLERPMRMWRKKGWQVLRAMEEESVMGWVGERSQVQLVIAGQRIRVYPWDGGMALKGFQWALVVDSSVAGKEDEIVDVWVRWDGRG